MKKLWCVVECDSDGYMFDPDFFKTKEEAIAFVNRDANESYGQSLDYENTNIRISDDGMKAKVWTDEMSWYWKVFDVSTEVVKAL